MIKISEPQRGFPQFGNSVPHADYILRPGGYLLLKNLHNEYAIVFTPNGLFLPGGGQESGESAAEAASREALEEFGLRVLIREELGAADELVFAASEGKYFRKRCVFFKAELIDREQRSEQDHRLVWMSSHQAIRQLNHRSHAWAVIQEMDPENTFA